MRMLGDANYVESEGTQKVQLTREKQSGNVKQYSSLIQTFGVFKRSGITGDIIIPSQTLTANN